MSGFGGAVKLTGESEYRNALKKITQNLKEVSSEMKLVSSSYDKNDKSVQALTAKQNALTQKLDQQKQKLSMIQTAYKDMSSQYEQNKTKHETLVAEYDKEKAKLEQIGKELGTDSKEYQEQAKVVDKLEKEVAESTKAQDANEKALSNMRIEMNKAQADINKTQRELDKLDTELEEAKKAEENASKGMDKFGKSLKDTKSDTDQADKGFTVLKGTLAVLASEAITKCISGLKELGSTAIQAWKDFDQGTDIIIAKTGATGQSAEELEDIYTSISSRIVASNEEIGTSVGEVSTRFGVTGKDLESLSEKFLKFAKLNNTDVNSSIDNTQKALSAFGLGADDAGFLLDVFNKVGQDTGVSMDKLMAGLIQNGTAFQEMGLSIEDSVALMGQMEKSGANSETVMNGLRKALKNATADGIPLNEALSDLEDSIVNNKDETEGLAKAYDIFGKSGDQIYGALKNGTLSFKDITGATGDFKDSVDKTFDSIQDTPEQFDLAIQNIKTQMAGLTDNIMKKFAPQIDSAFETIGKVVDSVFKGLNNSIDFFVKYGDIIVTTLGAMAMGVGAYVAYSTALKIMEGGWMAIAIVEKIVTKGQLALNTAMSANPIGLVIAGIVALVAGFIILWKRSEKFRNFWKGLWKGIKKAFEPVINFMSKMFKSAWDGIKKVWSVCVAFFARIWAGIKAVFKGVVNFYKGIFLGAWTVIKEIWTVAVAFFAQIWAGIKAVFAGVATWFGNIFRSAVSAIKSAFSGIGSFFSSVWKSVTSAFPNVAKWFGDKFGGVMDAIKNKFSGWAKFWSGLWDKVKTTFKSLGAKIGDAMVGAIKGGLNKVIGKIEGIINKGIGLINSAIGLANKLPGVNVSKLSKLSLPRLYQGGILEKGQWGLIEGSGAEAVVPLEKNTKWIGKVADSFRTEFASMARENADNAPQALRYDETVDAFKEALSDMQIILDNETAGKFIEKTVTRYVYA